MILYSFNRCYFSICQTISLCFFGHISLFPRSGVPMVQSGRSEWMEVWNGQTVSLLLRDRKILPVGLIPDFAVFGCKLFQFDRIGDDAPHLPNVLHAACCFRLQHDVPERRPFLRACQDGNSTRVRRELIEILILRTAADDVQHLDVEVGKFPQPSDHLAVAES